MTVCSSEPLFRFYLSAGTMKFTLTADSLPFVLFCLSLNILCRQPFALAQTVYSISTLDEIQDTGLSAPCEAAYTETISGCQMSDFITTNQCSASCQSSLQSVQLNVQSACADDTISSTSLLSYFNSGNGVNQLCVVMKSAATTMSTVVSSAPTATSSLSSGTQTSAKTSASGATEPLVTGSTSPTPSATAQKSTSGILALPRVVLIAIVIGIVVGFALLALVTYFCFNVERK